MVEAERSFGVTSAFDVAVPRADGVPFELPVARYLSEALLGMYGSECTEKGKPVEATPNWRRLKKALGTAAAHSVSSALAWIAIGVIFDTVAQEATEEFRDQLCRSWFALMGELDPQARDWILDALPSVLVQAVYRLIVDAFPPERAQIVQHAGKILEKLGVIIQHEVLGFHLNVETSREVRRRFFKRPVMEHPYLDTVEAMRAELRHQQLKGQNAEGKPLAFGHIKTGQPLEEMQLEHVMELRAAGNAGHGPAVGAPLTLAAQAAAAQLPPLVPPDLNVDRYAGLSVHGEELYRRHFKVLNLELPANLDDDDEDDQKSNGGPEETEARECPSPLSPLSPSPGSRRTFNPRSSWGWRQQRDRQEAAERRRRDEFLASQIAAPVPEAYRKRSLETNTVSPLFDRLAPGAQAQQPSESHNLCMAPPSTTFLPKLTKANAARAGSQSESETTASGRRRRSDAAVSNSSTAVSSSKAANKVLPRILEATGEHHHGPVGLLEYAPLRVKTQAVLQRLEQDLEACHRASFEQYKRDYDLQTGQKKSRLDGQRLAREEASYVVKLTKLVGSRSTPAFRLLGPGGEERFTKSSRPALGSGSTSSLTTGPGSLSGGGRGYGPGRKPWNELTGLDAPPLRR